MGALNPFPYLPYCVQLSVARYVAGIPHGAPLGRRTRPEAAHAAPEVPW